MTTECSHPDTIHTSLGPQCLTCGYLFEEKYGVPAAWDEEND